MISDKKMPRNKSRYRAFPNINMKNLCESKHSNRNQ